MSARDDKCSIEVIGELTAERSAVLSMLYFPLIGSDAINLYHLLYALGTRKQKIKNHLLIEALSAQSNALLEKSRRLLEQYLLLKTYYRSADNQYLYQVFLPLSGNDFLRHEVFGRLYMKKMGKQVYEFNKLSFAPVSHDLQEYQEITMPFTNILTKDWKDKEEEQFRKSRPKQELYLQNDLPLSFQFDRFLQGFSAAVFPLSARNEKNLRSIGELATIHGIDEMTMRRLVSQSMNLKDNTLDLEKLRKKARNVQSEWKEQDEEHPYQLPPVQFLQNKQRGIPVSRSDKLLIELLISEFRLKPEVVNVLIEYVLQKTNQKFPKSYVERVAGEWVRLHIETSEEALAHIKEEQPKAGRTQKKKELPKWFHEQDQVQGPDVEVDEEKLQEMMKQLRGEE